MFASGSCFGSAVSASLPGSFYGVAAAIAAGFGGAAIGSDFLRIRVTYDPSAGTVMLIPSASRHSQTLLRLCPASSAALISGHNSRICAAFVGGFFCREVPRGGRGHSANLGLEVDCGPLESLNNLRRRSADFNSVQQIQLYTTIFNRFKRRSSKIGGVPGQRRLVVEHKENALRSCCSAAVCSFPAWSLHGIRFAPPVSRLGCVRI